MEGQKMSREVELLKEYAILYEEYEKQSLCLDEEVLKKAKSFAFIHDYENWSCGGIRFGYIGFPVDNNGYVYGSFFTYFRFKRAIREAKKYIKKYINKGYSAEKVKAEILKREIEIMKKRFRFTKYDKPIYLIESPFIQYYNNNEIISENEKQNI